MNDRDLNNAIQLVFDRTGLLPEVESAEELADCLVTWGEEIAAENESLKQQLRQSRPANKSAATHC